ncbi:hypothetical protein C8R44DRAFT_894193 [Mycena epipterygia]|nr:hypothetical protein C8R44DRAFT_894193 [Mycena epipterygia]
MQSFTPPTVPVLQILSSTTSATDLLPMFTLPANGVVELSIPGRNAGVPHPFHLHGHNFFTNIAANISGDTISEDLGDMPELHFLVRLPTLKYRHVTLFFLNFHRNPAAETEEDNAYNLLAHHTSRMLT